MSLKVYTSTSLKDLAQKLSEETKENNKNVFQPDFIVTPNNGLNKWLKVEIAEQNGIAANVQFFRMAQVSTIIYKILGGKKENKEELSFEQLQWMLFDLMGADDFSKAFPEIANYFGSDFQKRFALAGKVSELFNKYQTFIPEKITDWQNTKDETNENEIWQEYLWSKLKAGIKDSFYTEIETNEYVNEILKDSAAQKDLNKKLPVLYLFNLNDLSTANIDLLLNVSRYIEINIYFFSPISNMDFNNISNSLLNNWIRNQKTILQYLKSQNVEVISIGKRVSAEASTLLQKLQKDITHNTEQSVITEKDLKDESLVVNACYTPNREVEVLYNFLVKTVISDKSNSIGAKDIAVFCTDITKYSASIKAVFDTAPYKFPYHIMDDSGSDTASPLKALESLFSIDTRWFKPEEVMHLLEYPSVRNRFEITDVALLRKLVNAANIRNGYTGEKVNETNLISWEHGLKRLMLGLCLSGDESFPINGDSYLLIDETEGRSGYELIRFRFFTKLLKEHLENLSDIKELEDWVEYIRTSIDLFLDTDKDPRMQELDKELAGLLAIKSKVKEAIPFNTFFACLREILAKIGDETTGLKKGITFCSTMPSRSVPFKVIALLGLNYDTFPRKGTNLSFDLLTNTAAAEIIDYKEKDKFFFLETVLAAENKLYLSYIGRDSKNNKERPPSSLIDELKDYLRLKYTGDRNKFPLITLHPLHSFDSKYFDDTLPDFYTYLGKNDNGPGVDFFRRTDPPENIPLVTEVPVFKLINFLKDPFKYYYNTTLGIYYSDEDELLSSEELFDLDTLQAWSIKSKLVKSADLLENDKLRLEAVEKGEIPLAGLGQVMLKEINEKAKPARDRYLEETKGIPETEWPVDIPVISGILLKGVINGVYSDKFIYCNVSSGEIKYKIAAFIECLILNASGKQVDLYYNSINDGNIIKIKSNEFRTKEAKDLLKSVLTWFSLGGKKIVPFYPALTDVLPELLAEPDKREEIIDSALSEDGYLSEYVNIEWVNYFFADKSNRDELTENLEFINTSILSKFN